jgi:hypothetical protein
LTNVKPQNVVIFGMSSRRQLLVGLGAVLSLGGCSQTEESDSPTANPTGSTTSANSDTPTHTSTPTQASAQDTTKSPIETTKETTSGAEDETRTPTPDPRVNALNTIEQKLIEILSHFSLNDEINTRPLQLRVRDAGSNDQLYETRSEFNSINTDELTSRQSVRYSRLKSAYWFVWWIELLHNTSKEINDAVPESWDNKRGTAVTPPPLSSPLSPVNPLRDSLSAASGRLEQLIEYSDNKGLAELEGYESEDFNAVVKRYERVIAQGELLIEQIRLHQEANGYWRNEAYKGAEENHRANARSHIETNWLESFKPTIDEMVCYAEAMADRSEVFYRAQRLEEEGETEAAKIERELAPPEAAEVCDFE